MVMSRPTVFVREATGLVRDFSWFDGMILNLGYINIGWIIVFFYAFGLFAFPGSDMTLTFSLVTFVFSIPVIIAYAYFAAAMPRSGGDYIFVSRTLNGAAGFAVSMIFLIYLEIVNLGLCSWFVSSGAVAPSLAALGYITQNPGLLAISKVVAQPLASVALGVVIILFVFVFLVLTPSSLHKVLAILFVIAFLGFPVLYVILLAMSSNGQFVAAFNSYATQGNLGTSYDAIISSAKNAGAVILAPTLIATLATMPFALSNPQSSTYIGGETKAPTRHLPIGLISAIVVMCISMYVAGYVTYRVFGYDFLAATGYYYFSGAAGNPLPAAPYANYFLGILYPNLAMNLFMLVSLIAWQLLVCLSFGLMATRTLFALAFDRLVPSRLADVSDRFHTPVFAAVLVTIIGIFFLVLTTYSAILTILNMAIGFTSAYIIVMICALIYPFLRKNLFEGAPPPVKRRIGGIPLISIFAAISLVPLLSVYYYTLTVPAIAGVTPTAIEAVFSVYVVAIILFYAIKAYRKTQGIDLDMALREIPPE